MDCKLTLLEITSINDMGYNNIKEEDVPEILYSEDKLKVLLDTNVLIAYLDKTHKFNYVASAIIDPLKDKDCYFFVPHLVIGEFIKIWMDTKKASVASTIKEIRSFLDSSLKFSLTGGTPLTTTSIFSSFKRHSKHKNFLKAYFNDFIILTEAENIKNIKVITCDKAMHDAGKTIFKNNIYYIPLGTKKGKSELGRFITSMEGVNI